MASLTTLPPEIRLMIYSYLLQTENCIDVAPTGCVGVKYHLSILRVNRFIHGETIRYFHQINAFLSVLVFKKTSVLYSLPVLNHGTYRKIPRDQLAGEGQLRPMTNLGVLRTIAQDEDTPPILPACFLWHLEVAALWSSCSSVKLTCHMKPEWSRGPIWSIQDALSSPLHPKLKPHLRMLMTSVLKPELTMKSFKDEGYGAEDYWLDLDDARARSDQWHEDACAFCYDRGVSALEEGRLDLASNRPAYVRAAYLEFLVGSMLLRCWENAMGSIQWSTDEKAIVRKGRLEVVNIEMATKESLCLLDLGHYDRALKLVDCSWSEETEESGIPTQVLQSQAADGGTQYFVVGHWAYDSWRAACSATRARILHRRRGNKRGTRRSVKEERAQLSRALKFTEDAKGYDGSVESQERDEARQSEWAEYVSDTQQIVEGRKVDPQYPLNASRAHEPF